MMVGKRLIAFAIDFWLGIFSGMFVMAGLFYLIDQIVNVLDGSIFDLRSFLNALFNTPITGFFVLFLWAVIWPSLAGGFLNYKFNKTIGKFLLRLEVLNRSGGKLNFNQAFGRELTKILMLLISPLWIIPLFQAIMYESTFYDNYFGVVVVGKTRYSKVQDNYLKHIGKR